VNATDAIRAFDQAREIIDRLIKLAPDDATLAADRIWVEEQVALSKK
jgi:hypothetical protein